MAKRKVLTGLRIGNKGLNVPALRSAATDDPVSFFEKMENLIHEKGYRMKDIENLTGMFDALSGVPVPVHFDSPGGYERTIIGDAFALFIGNLAIAQIVEDPDETAYISDQLVTEMDDPHDITIVAGVDAHDVDVDEVKETERFPEIGASDESYVIHSKKNGRTLSISADMIRKNNVAGAVDKINKLQQIGRTAVEELTIKKVIDLDGSGSTPAAPYVLEREGAVAALYTTSSDSPTVKTPDGTRLTNRALVDYTDLDAAREHLNGYRNDLEKRVNIPMSKMTLFTPDALVGTASHVLNSIMIPGEVNTKNNWGPEGMWRPTLLSTPRLDDYSTNAWYLGDFKGQFRRKWSQRWKYVTLGNTTESYLTNDIAFQARFSWVCDIGAVSSNRVVQCLGGTTQPAA